MIDNMLSHDEWVSIVHYFGEKDRLPERAGYYINYCHWTDKLGAEIVREDVLTLSEVAHDDQRTVEEISLDSAQTWAEIAREEGGSLGQEFKRQTFKREEKRKETEELEIKKYKAESK